LRRRRSELSRTRPKNDRDASRSRCGRGLDLRPVDGLDVGFVQRHGRVLEPHHDGAVALLQDHAFEGSAVLEPDRVRGRRARHAEDRQDRQSLHVAVLPKLKQHI